MIFGNNRATLKVNKVEVIAYYNIELQEGKKICSECKGGEQDTTWSKIYVRKVVDKKERIFIPQNSKIWTEVEKRLNEAIQEIQLPVCRLH